MPGMRRILPFVVLVALGVGAKAQDGEGGGDAFLACGYCHVGGGAASVGALYPDISGMPARYILRQLNAYADGLRESELMARAARSLSHDERVEHARRFAEAPGPEPRAPDRTATLGARIATEGLWERGVPPCESCHAAAEGERPNLSPALAGQPRAYLEAQLRAYADWTRVTDPMGRMRAFAGKLSDREIAAIADYYAGGVGMARP